MTIEKITAAELGERVASTAEQKTTDLPCEKREEVYALVAEAIPEVIQRAVEQVDLRARERSKLKIELLSYLSYLLIDDVSQQTRRRIKYAVSGVCGDDNPRLYEVVRKSAQDFLKQFGFGRKTLEEFAALLAEVGLELGMEIPDDLKQEIEAEMAERGEWPPNFNGREISEGSVECSYLSWNIDSLPWDMHDKGLVTRTKNGLRNLLQRNYPDPVYVYEIVTHSRFRILQGSKNLGQKGIQLLEDTLRKLGLGLGMIINPDLINRLQKK